MKHDGIRWQAAVVCGIADPEPKAGAVDVGLRRLATGHDGAVPIMIAKPRPLKRTLIKLRRVKRINRRIARSRTIHGKDRHSNRRARP